MKKFIEHHVQFAETNSVVIIVEDGIITGVELPNNYGDNCLPEHQAHDGGFVADYRNAKALVGQAYQPHPLDCDASEFVGDTQFYTEAVMPFSDVSRPAIKARIISENTKENGFESTIEYIRYSEENDPTWYRWLFDADWNDWSIPANAKSAYEKFVNNFIA